MLAKKYRSKVISISNPLEGLYTVQLESTRGKFKYSPGQFLHLALDESYDGVGQWPDSRCFSMQSSPDEEMIRITYAVKGGFTKMMEQTLKYGTDVWLKLPYGDLFSQAHNRDKVVFISGGTGVTPFLSLFTHSSFCSYLEPKIYLGFKTKAHHLYKNELDIIQNPHAGIKIFYENVHGIIDIHEIIEENRNAFDYFISGPPAMISDFKNTMVSEGIDAQKIHSDDWG